MTFRMLGVDEVAAILDCVPGTVEEMMRTKRLPGMKAGRSWRVTEAALFNALDVLCSENLSEKSAQSFVGTPMAYEVSIPTPVREAANTTPRRRQRAAMPDLSQYPQTGT